MVRSKQKVFRKRSSRCAVSIKMSQSWTSKNQTALRTNDVIISKNILLTRKFLLTSMPTHRERCWNFCVEDLRNIHLALDVPRAPALFRTERNQYESRMLPTAQALRWACRSH